MPPFLKLIDYDISVFDTKAHFMLGNLCRVVENLNQVWIKESAKSVTNQAIFAEFTGREIFQAQGNHAYEFTQLAAQFLNY